MIAKKKVEKQPGSYHRLVKKEYLKKILFHRCNYHHRKAMTIMLNGESANKKKTDGLPIYKSLKKEFWPITFNITEPMVIGIYYGYAKAIN